MSTTNRYPVMRIYKYNPNYKYRSNGYSGYRPAYKKYTRNYTGTRRTNIGALRKNFVPRTLGNPLAIAERKYFDSVHYNLGVGYPITYSITTWANTEFDPTGLNTLFCPTQGTDYTQRIGRKVQLLSLRINFILNVPVKQDAVLTIESIRTRIILYMDKQANGTQSQGEDVMATTNSDPLTAFTNPRNYGRFKIIKDKKINFSNIFAIYDSATVDSSGLVRSFSMSYKPKKPLYVEFSGSSGTFADIVNNSFHLIAVTSMNDPQVFGRYSCRGCYIDV